MSEDFDRLKKMKDDIVARERSAQMNSAEVYVEAVELAKAALAELERVGTIELAALGRYVDAESVGRARVYLDKLIGRKKSYDER